MRRLDSRANATAARGCRSYRLGVFTSETGQKASWLAALSYALAMTGRELVSFCAVSITESRLCPFFFSLFPSTKRRRRRKPLRRLNGALFPVLPCTRRDNHSTGDRQRRGDEVFIVRSCYSECHGIQILSLQGCKKREVPFCRVTHTAVLSPYPARAASGGTSREEKSKARREAQGEVKDCRPIARSPSLCPYLLSYYALLELWRDA